MKMPLADPYAEMAALAATRAAEYIEKRDVYMAMMKLGEAQRELALAMTWGQEKS